MPSEGKHEQPYLPADRRGADEGVPQRRVGDEPNEYDLQCDTAEDQRIAMQADRENRADVAAAEKHVCDLHDDDGGQAGGRRLQVQPVAEFELSP